MSKTLEIFDRLKNSGVVAVVRTDQLLDLIEVVRALAKGGVCFTRGDPRVNSGRFVWAH